jgi:hypothetical protein
VIAIYQVTGIGATFRGYNGGGDWYYTDGELSIALISSNNLLMNQRSIQSINPPAIEAKY